MKSESIVDHTIMFDQQTSYNVTTSPVTVRLLMQLVFKSEGKSYILNVIYL